MRRLRTYLRGRVESARRLLRWSDIEHRVMAPRLRLRGRSRQLHAAQLLQLLAGMQERELPQSRLSKKTDQTKSLCCTQCGGPLDAAAIKRFATRMDKVQCRDCAFDEMPCTD